MSYDLTPEDAATIRKANPSVLFDDVIVIRDERIRCRRDGNRVWCPPGLTVNRGERVMIGGQSHEVAEAMTNVVATRLVLRSPTVR